MAVDRKRTTQSGFGCPVANVVLDVSVQRAYSAYLDKLRSGAVPATVQQFLYGHSHGGDAFGRGFGFGKRNSGGYGRLAQPSLGYSSLEDDGDAVRRGNIDFPVERCGDGERHAVGVGTTPRDVVCEVVDNVEEASVGGLRDGGHCDAVRGEVDGAVSNGLKGKHYERNRKRKESKKLARELASRRECSGVKPSCEEVVGKVATVVGSVGTPAWRKGAAPLSGEIDTLSVAEKRARESLAIRRDAENRVAAAKAEFHLKQFEDEKLNGLKREALEARWREREMKSRASSVKSLSDCGSISPGSSVSLADVKQQAKRLEEKEEIIELLKMRLMDLGRYDDLKMILGRMEELDKKYEMTSQEMGEVDTQEEAEDMSDEDFAELERKRELVDLGIRIVHDPVEY